LAVWTCAAPQLANLSTSAVPSSVGLPSDRLLSLNRVGKRSITPLPTLSLTVSGYGSFFARSAVLSQGHHRLYMSTNLVHHRQAKHIELDIPFVREKVALGELRVVHVPSTQHLADIILKGLPKASFQSSRRRLNCGCLSVSEHILG
jgi:hypothetical protein